MTRRVVVTGLGLVTPLGHDLETVWEALLGGRSAVGPAVRYADPSLPVKAGGEVPAQDVAALRAEHGEGAESTDLRTVFAVAAAKRALAHAGLSPSSAGRGAVVVGSGPGAHRFEDFVRFSGGDGVLDATRLYPERETVHRGSLWRSPPERPAAEIARRFGIAGPVRTITTACTASVQSVGLAMRDLRAGRADGALAGGTDSMVDPIGLVFFAMLNVASTEAGPGAVRPFAARRGGSVMGEGAAFAVLETEEHARARGATPLAEAAGYGSSLDAHGVTAPHPGSRGIVEAMRRALADGGLSPQDVDYVAAHATGTRLNDPLEARAIRVVFGPGAARVAVSSTKAATGHLLAAAGALSFATAVLAVARGAVPPTLNLETVDPTCALDHVRGTARRTPVRAALVNALAFGGHNATIAVRAVRGKDVS